jgi:hypothetical protein
MTRLDRRIHGLIGRNGRCAFHGVIPCVALASSRAFSFRPGRPDEAPWSAALLESSTYSRPAVRHEAAGGGARMSRGRRPRREGGKSRR